MTDLTASAGAGVGADTTSPWPTFAVSAIATYIAALDLSIVNVAFAEIAGTFADASRGAISWVVTAYTIMFGSLLVVSGRMADRIGRRRMLLAGVATFMVGSLLCAISPNLELLIGGRAIQGVGSAMMMPAALGLLLAAFPIERRSQAIAWNGSAGALGVASGPTLGAFLVAGLGWRSAFWINVPICVVVTLWALHSIREPPRPALPPADVLASVFLSLSVASLVWGISRAESDGWSDPGVAALLAAAVVLGLTVAVRSVRHPTPLLPPAMFRQRAFTVANVATFIFGAGFAANILNNVLFLRTIWQYGVVKAGLFSVLAPVVVAVSAIIAGRAISRVGFRTMMVTAQAGFAIITAALVVLLDDAPAPWTRWLPLMLLLGISIGFSFPAMSAAAMSTLGPTEFALGGAINNTFRQIGAAVGVALVVTMQSTADGIDGFRAGWLFVAVCGTISALVSLAQPGKS